jgi:hypothetical protein
LRLRPSSPGHSSLNGALDAQILRERIVGDLAATLTLQKLKDDASEVMMRARACPASSSLATKTRTKYKRWLSTSSKTLIRRRARPAKKRSRRRSGF